MTSQAGLLIIGQCLDDSINIRYPASLGMRNGDVIDSYLGLLCLGMSDYDAIDNFRSGKPFKLLLILQQVPRTATFRQRLEKS
ncbi:MAG: hypothetical protein LC677_09225 [Halomonas sp.]|nr:hypothetical protein [Halomonas sp.]